MPGQRGLRGPVALPRSNLRMSIFFCRTEGAPSRRNIWYWRRVKRSPFRALQDPANQRCAIAGIWPFAEGRIHIPAGIRVMVVPAKPYIPISTLRAAVTYPAVSGTYLDDDIRRALTQ